MSTRTMPSPSAATAPPAALAAVMALAGVVAAALLVLRYGLRPPLPVDEATLFSAAAAIIGVFILDRLMRLVLTGDRAAALSENGIDLAMIVAASVATIIFSSRGDSIWPIMAGALLYIIISQAYQLGAWTIRRLGEASISPPAMFVLAFLTLVLAGTAMLSLPAATPEKARFFFVDAVFTAVSAACGVGLVVKDTGGDFTPLGQGVILVLVQAGGMAMLFFGSLLVMKIVSPQRVAAHQGLRRLGASVVLVALAIEAVGAALLYPMFAAPQGPHTPAPAQAAWDSIFTSVCAFCNAGFSLYRENLMAGAAQGWEQPLRSHWQVLGVIAPLAVLGGLGLPVLLDLGAWLRSGLRTKLSSHSQLVIAVTVLLLIGGACGLLLIQRGDASTNVVGRHAKFNTVGATVSDWNKLTPPQRLASSLFQSASARTAGFTILDVTQLSDASKFWLCGLMTVGGGPGGTAGGMKVVTLAVLLAAAWGFLRRRDDQQPLAGAAAPLLRTALLAAFFFSLLIATTAILLCLAQPTGQSFIDLFFEACSACTSTGLTAGVTGPTTSLNEGGKYILAGAMAVGRLGLLVMLLHLADGMQGKPQEIAIA
ncbi:MAG: hypothetical protein LLG01_02305 [Planctomycetaceae bacterium]|nr:hypothetical protein [Planctomycetaceae bacterium]